MASTMSTFLPIITLLSLIQFTSSINCGSLKIVCATGEPECYKGACAKIAEYMIDQNTLPLMKTPSPTILYFSLTPTISPTNMPSVTRFLPTTHIPTIITSTPTTTATPTNPPTTTLISTSTSTTVTNQCTQCNCDCNLCNESEQCMTIGPRCIWLLNQCLLIPDGIFPTTTTTVLPTTSTMIIPTPIPTLKITKTPTNVPTTTSSIATTVTTVSTNEPITIETIQCNSNINGLYGQPTDIVIFELILIETQYVNFDACHSDLPPIINVYNENRNEILNKCNIFNGCCGLNDNNSGLITKLLPGIYYFEFTYSETDYNDLRIIGKNIAIYHIHFICNPITTTTTTDDDDITSTTTKHPTTSTTTKTPTVQQTTKIPTVYMTSEVNCNECNCDCTICNQAEQCIVIGPNCIWSRGDCIDNINNNNIDLCPLDVVENMDIILLVDNSCGLNDNECIIRQKGIAKFMNSVVSIDDIYPRIGYITYSTADNINVLLPLINENNINVINDINNYQCNDNINTFSTDISAGISVAIREFAIGNININQNNNKIRKLIIFSNCKHRLDTTSPCTLINELTIDGFIIDVIVVNIPCKKQLPYYDINSLKCLTMNETNKYITLDNNTDAGFNDKISIFKSTICNSNKNMNTNAPTLSPVSCPQIGESCTSAYKSEERCCNGHKRQGFARCLYDKFDSFGHKLGICCVRKNRPGCINDTNCCNENRVCYKGYCLSQPKIDTWKDDDLAIEITENGDFAEWSTTFDEKQEEKTIFGLNRTSQIFGLIMIFLCLICNLLYCYWHFGVKKKNNNNNEMDNNRQIDMDYIHRNCMYNENDLRL